MNTNQSFTVIVIIALLLGACAPRATPATDIPPGTIPLTGSIGIISAEKTLVESGPSEKLIQVTQIQDFFNNDTVRVTNGGTAKLDLLGNQISIRLFNDTALEYVKADPSDTPDPAVRMRLAFGGLIGEITKDGIPAHFEIANGVNIYILGTQFLVLYDPLTQTTYIGNFEGTIAYTLPGGQVRFVQSGQIYEISPSFETRTIILNFTRTEIETRTSETGSRLVDTLEEYYLEPTSTPTATPTPSPTVTSTPTPSPTITPTPTTLTLCDKADFVTDVTVPDGTSFSPGFQFTKIWRLRNVGTCTWTNSYSFVFYKGEQMGGPTSVNIPSTVAPGQTVDVAVGLVAPALPGPHRGDWMLRNASGTTFGAGANGTTPIWVAINVVDITTTTPPVGSPDLTVSITSGPASNCDPKIPTNCVYITTVEFVITNTSQAEVTSSFEVLIEATGYPYGDLPSKTIPVNGLAAGASQTYSESLSGLCYSCTAHVTVDYSNIILESNEANNVSEKTS